MTTQLTHNSYLGTLHSSPTCTLAALEWAQYLGSTFGARGALAALRYYQDLGWISESVRTRMVEHLEGLSLSELQAQRDDPPIEGALATLTDSPFAPHLGSLWYIARVAGDDIDTMLEETRLQFGEFTPQLPSKARIRTLPSEESGVPT